MYRETKPAARQKIMPEPLDCRVDRDADHLAICLPNHGDRVLRMNVLTLIYRFGFCLIGDNTTVSDCSSSTWSNCW